MKRKIYQYQKWSNYLSVRKWWKNIALFTPLRYVGGVDVQLYSVLALALKGGHCSTLQLTTSLPGKVPHYPLNSGLGGL